MLSEHGNVVSLLTLNEAVKKCKACPLGFRGDGVPGEFVLEDVADAEVMVILEAPGGVEQEVGRPVWGESGQLFRAMMKECGVHSYYVTNVAKHRPLVIKGKQQRPDVEVVKACSGFLDAEIAMVRPAKLILCGNVAASRILGIPGNTSQASIVNRVFQYVGGYGEVPTLVLYHPAYFLHNRTSVWVNKGLNDWKRALRNFMGADIPHYLIEEVKCQTHS